MDELDKILEQRDIKFCRYADDIQIYCTSLRAAHRTMDNTIKSIESNRFKLKVNTEKSAVKNYNDSKFLGYSFRRCYKKNKIVLCVHKKSFERFKSKIRKTLKRNRGITIKQYIIELNQIHVGWINYFYLGLTNWKISAIDGWIRSKIRVILWKQWKTSKNRKKMYNKYAKYKQKGVNSSKGMFNVASYQLKFSLTNKVISEIYGFKEGVKTYQKIWDKRKEIDLFNQTLFLL